MEAALPAYLYHYYERDRGPFSSLTALPPGEAEALLEEIRREGAVFAGKRAADYLAVRRELEQQVRALFIAKGSRPRRDTPHYLILGSCPWVKGWYRDGRAVRIPFARCLPETVSFTYGDTFPAMRYQDGKPYRGRIYTLDELPRIIRLHGLPQVWSRDGRLGPDRYIEAQLWDDEPIMKYLRQRGK